MAKKKLFLAQAMYEEAWLVWAEDEGEAVDGYWEHGKKALDHMPWFEMDEIDPEVAKARYGEIPEDV